MSIRHDKKRITDTWYNVDEPQKNFVKQRKPNSKVMSYNFTYIKYSEYLNPQTQKANPTTRRIEMGSLHLINMEISLEIQKYFET